MAYDAPYPLPITDGHIAVRTGSGTRNRIDTIAKRMLDCLLAVIALVLVAPLFAVLYVQIRLDGGPCFYGHARIGLGGKTFRCLKFRTMVPDSDAALQAYLADHPDAAAEWLATRKLQNDPRVTSIGRTLRCTSLDEIPQLINVLRGEMSLVGPRPITEAEAVLYGPAIVLYHAVRPGITGLWQVSGRSLVSYQRRVELDTLYVREWSLWTDLLIMLKTVPALLSREGAY